MTAWLPSFVAETLIWTGLLIALVLLIRRPVGRYFGPRAAYALWLLPALRLIMPPLVLPAWLAPASEQSGLHTAEITASAAELANIMAIEAAASAPGSVSWVMALIAIWLTGVVIFIAIRFSSYFDMRRALLADGTPVSEDGPAQNFGSVRLVETPAATAPLALGVIDKVIVLPAGFMALNNREERNFALEHELAHHAGHDLLANMAVQPLFALHWFNPLAWLGWRAMRRDQEAACDARVIARRSATDKATYAHTIASFAAGPHVSLAAPMACPVLGEKSIIHRLRSISMSDISPRRRLAGRALMAASLLALPLTASISYAEVIAQEAPNEGLNEALNEAPSEQVETGATYVPPVVLVADPKVTFVAKPKVTFTAKPKATFTGNQEAADSSEKPRVVFKKTDPADGAKPKFTYKKNDPADAEKPKFTLKVSKEKLEELKAKHAANPRPQYRMRLDKSKLTPEQREQIRIKLIEKKDELSAADPAQERRVMMLAQINAEGRLTKLTVDCKIHAMSGVSVAVSGGAKVIRSCGPEDQAKTPAKGAAITPDMRAKILARLKDRIALRTKVLSVPGESIATQTKQ